MRRLSFRTLLAILVGLGLALVVWRSAGPLWRAAYPYLPSRAQAVPYRLRAALADPAATPVPLPTPYLAARPAAGVSPTGPAPASTTATHDAPSPPPPTEAPAPNLPPAVGLPASTHEYQTWNNCGPATVSMALSHLGPSPGQAAAARFLKPDPDDKNVGPSELAAYARSLGFEAVSRVDGTADEMRGLLAIGLPVIVETWFVPEPGDEMGHYRVLIGYDDAAGHFVADDSYNGPGITLAYDAFDGLWRVFNRAFVVVYPPERAPEVRGILGDKLDDTAMYVGAVARAETELAASPDAIGWFNMGSSLLGLGDTAAAAAAYDRARALGLPWRMLWYQFGPFEAYAAEGRWDDVTALAEANLRNASNLEESHYWLGRAQAARGDEAAARASFRRALELRPGYQDAQAALEGLP